MNKKILFFSLIMLFILFFSNFCYATDIVMDLNNLVTGGTNNTLANNTNDANESFVDNTIYSSSPETETETDEYIEETEPIITTTTNYEDSGDLSITNMINIILIVVGIVLILLGIAIIIRINQK